MCVCVYCLCLTRRISASNPSANAITLHNLLAKDIDQYFKTELNAEESLPPKSELILPNGLCKFWKHARDRNLIYTVGGIWTKSRYQYGDFFVRPENTHSYVLKLTTWIITYIIICHSSWMLCLYDVNLRDYASHILCI